MILVPAPMTKSPSPGGNPVELDGLSFPELTDERRAVLGAIGRDDLWVAPATPARELYGGPLLKAAFEGLSADASARADRDLVYVSGLWGAVRTTDALPDYRLHICERPAGLGHLVQFWQEPLESVLSDAAGDGLVIDTRAAEYLIAWRPTGPLAERWVGIKAVRDASFETGSSPAVSKAVRGRVLHRILSERIEASHPVALADALAEIFTVQLRPPADHRHPWELRVLQPD